MKFQIIDPNISPKNQVIAESPFADVAEIMAQGYTEARYGNALFHQHMRPIRVLDTEDDRVIAWFGHVNKLVVGKLP